MQSNLTIEKLEINQLEEITSVVYSTMKSANQLPNSAYLFAEDIKKILMSLLKNDMERKHLLCYGIIKQEMLIAMIGYEEDTKKITYLYVLPEYQKQGLGTELLNFIIKNENKASKVLISAHESAVAMYEKYGFKKNGDDSTYAIGMEYILRRN